MAAVPAVSVNPAHPRNANPRSDRKLDCLTLDDLTDNLVAGDTWDSGPWQIAFNDVQVRSTDSASKNAKKKESWLYLRTRYILEIQKRSVPRLQRKEYGGFHKISPTRFAIA